VANTLDLLRSGGVGFIVWLGFFAPPNVETKN